MGPPMNVAISHCQKNSSTFTLNDSFRTRMFRPTSWTMLVARSAMETY